MSNSWSVSQGPNHYGDPVAEYAAMGAGVGLCDRSHLGRVQISGSDGLDLLNRLSTQKMETFSIGEGALTVVTTSKGRVVDLIACTMRPGHVLCLTSPDRQSAFIEWIDFFVFSEDVEIHDVTDATSMFGLAGPKAETLLKEFGAPVSELSAYHSVNTVIEGVEVLIWRTLEVGIEAYELILQADCASKLQNVLLSAGSTLVGKDAWEAHRIGHGLPAYGAEFNETVNPLESGLAGCVSFDKGCYVGQEVVARLNTYHKVQRKLMSVRLNGHSDAGAELLDAGHRVGRLTSVAQVPGTEHMALALVRRQFAEKGVRLDMAKGGTAVLEEPACGLFSGQIGL